MIFNGIHNLKTRDKINLQKGKIRRNCMKNKQKERKKTEVRFLLRIWWNRPWSRIFQISQGLSRRDSFFFQGGDTQHLESFDYFY